MEMTKKKWFTLLGFGAAVALPMSMIIHTANEGLKAAIITEEHVETAKDSIGSANGEITVDGDVSFKQLDLAVTYDMALVDVDADGNFESKEVVADYEEQVVLTWDEYLALTTKPAEDVKFTDLTFATEAATDADVYVEIISADLDSAVDGTDGTLDYATVEYKWVWEDDILDSTELAAAVAIATDGELVGAKFTDLTLTAGAADEADAYIEIDSVTIDYTDPTGDYAVVEYTRVTPLDLDDKVTASFTFSAKEDDGYTLVRTDPKADNSQAEFINFTKEITVK